MTTWSLRSCYLQVNRSHTQGATITENVSSCTVSSCKTRPITHQKYDCMCVCVYVCTLKWLQEKKVMSVLRESSHNATRFTSEKIFHLLIRRLYLHPRKTGWASLGTQSCLGKQVWGNTSLQGALSASIQQLWSTHLPSVLQGASISLASQGWYRKRWGNSTEWCAKTLIRHSMPLELREGRTQPQ